MSWAQRSTTDSSLSLKACLRYSRATIKRIGRHGRPAALSPPATTTAVGPNMSASSFTLPMRALRALRANSGASDFSISAHGMRLASTASGWRRSIMASSRA